MAHSKRQLGAVEGKGKKSIRPKTALQRQLIEQRRKDLTSTESTSQALHAHFLGERIPTGPPLDPAQLPDEHPDPASNDWEDDPLQARLFDNLDLEDASPAGSQIQSYIDQLSKDRHMAKRLEREKDRVKESLYLLPIFLECLARTQDWGCEKLWNQDFKTACSCVNVRKRNVDLVDLLSM